MLTAQPDPIVVVAGGQAFVQRPTPARVARDARRHRAHRAAAPQLHPRRLRRDAARLFADLVLLSSAHDFSAEGKRRVQRQIDFAARGDLVGLTEDFVAVFRRPWLNWLLRLRLRTSRARLARSLNEPELIIRGLRAVLDDPIAPAALARVAAPALIIGGTRDQFFGDGAQQRTAALLPCASLELIDGETHMLAVERAAIVARALRRFLG